VEIGSYKGKSTVVLAEASDPLGKVFAIDPHYEGSKDEFLKNVSHLRNVAPIFKTSLEAWRDWNKGSVGMVWIDGDHEYTFVLADFYHWEQILMNGGIMALHDCTLAPGVKRVVKDNIFFNPCYTNIQFIGTIVSATRSRALMRNMFFNFFTWIMWEIYGAYSKKLFTLPTGLKNLIKRMVRSKLR